MRKLVNSMTVINTIGAVGYMLLVTVWAFFVAIIIGLVFDASSKLNSDIIMHSSIPSVSAESSMAVTIFSYVLAAAVLIVTVAILIMLPYLIGKWGSRMVRRLMSIVHIDVTLTQLFLVKGLLASLPLLGLIIINLVLLPESVTFAAMYVGTVVLAASSITLFFVQLLLARRLRISVDTIW